jgi:hypothetical protein
MKTDRSRVHHVVALVRPENLIKIQSRLSQVLRTPFYGPFDRVDAGIRVSISMDAGIELITPLSSDPADPNNVLLETRGEHWISIIVAVRDIEDVCKRLDELGHRPQHVYRNIPGELPPGGPPFADRFMLLDEFSFDPEAFAGLPIVLADIDEVE